MKVWIAIVNGGTEGYRKPFAVYTDQVLADACKAGSENSFGGTVQLIEMDTIDLPKPPDPEKKPAFRGAPPTQREA